MKKILIATKNKDKYEIVKRILSKINPSIYEYYNLYDLKDLVHDDKEVGSIEQRAYDKANQIYLSLKENEFEYIIGIDDGIKMKGVLRSNVKDYLEDIINGSYLKENEIVEIVRAYCFMNKEGKYKNIITTIPFEYKKLGSTIEIKENTFPLSYVFKALDSTKTIIERTNEENNEYYMKYSEQEIRKVLKHLI